MSRKVVWPFTSADVAITCKFMTAANLEESGNSSRLKLGFDRTTITRRSMPQSNGRGVNRATRNRPLEINRGNDKKKRARWTRRDWRASLAARSKLHSHLMDDIDPRFIFAGRAIWSRTRQNSPTRRDAIVVNHRRSLRIRSDGPISGAGLNLQFSARRDSPLPPRHSCETPTRRFAYYA